MNVQLNRRERLRLDLRILWLDLKERLFDLANIAFPIFIVSGLLVCSVKFWWWLI